MKKENFFSAKMVTELNGTASAVEMETFLPGDGSGLKDSSSQKYKITPKDSELGNKYKDKDYWDPFAARKVAEPTTDCDTLTHLLKASLGTGILAMPDAFKNCGLTMGIFATIFVAFLCTYCSYILVKCAHELYHRTRVTAMSFAEVAESAFNNGPKPVQKYAPYARFLIQFGLFLTYFGTCSVYTVIIGKNFAQVIDHHTGESLDQRWIIGGCLVPLILLSWVPNLKKLAMVSMIANVFMGVGLGITFYYLVWDLPPISEVPQVAPIQNFPVFFSLTIFAMEAIGVVMPLENNMKTPTHFLGICGVLNQGMSGVTLIYIFLGFFGYYKFGDDCKYGSITLNLPVEDYAAQAVKILIALAVFCTYGLQFYVCLEIAWNGVKEHFRKNQKFWEYAIRTLLVTFTVILAIIVPTISPFIGLIGAFCFSILGLICPCIIEVIVFWDDLGKGKWIIWKNLLIGICGVMALVFGTYTSILDIASIYMPESEMILPDVMNTTEVMNSTLWGNAVFTHSRHLEGDDGVRRTRGRSPIPTKTPGVARGESDSLAFQSDLHPDSHRSSLGDIPVSPLRVAGKLMSSIDTPECGATICTRQIPLNFGGDPGPYPNPLLLAPGGALGRGPPEGTGTRAPPRCGSGGFSVEFRMSIRILLCHLLLLHHHRPPSLFICPIHYDLSGMGDPIRTTVLACRTEPKSSRHSSRFIWARKPPHHCKVVTHRRGRRRTYSKK